MDCIKIFFNETLQGEIKFESNSITIGRAQASDIPISNPGVSIRHATIKKEDRGYVIEDSGSKNGTSVNGKKISRQILNYGDTITIFKHTLKLTPWIPASETTKPRVSDGQMIDQSGTVEVDISKIGTLMEKEHS